jgi:membrane associated rhomboid family serine protease
LALTADTLSRSLSRQQILDKAANLPYDFVGRIYRFDPMDVPLNNGIDLILQIPEAEERPEQLGIYTRVGDKRWVFLGNRLDAEKRTLTTRVRGLGEFLIRDSEKPDISGMAPADSSRLTDDRPVLQAIVVDTLSGLKNEPHMAIYLDGVRVIAEYDPESKQLFYRPRRPLAPGRHEMRVVLEDYCGNTSSKTHLFWIDRNGKPTKNSGERNMIHSRMKIPPTRCGGYRGFDSAEYCVFHLSDLLPNEKCECVFVAFWRGTGIDRARRSAVGVFSSMFMHGGFMHLFGNMLYLWIFGDNIEQLCGHMRFILFYLLCGVFAFLSHFIFAPHSPIPMVGASGAISGVLGAYALRFPRARVLSSIWFFIIFWDVIRVPAVILLGLWFVMQLFSGVSSASDQAGVAWFAHIGGFIAGLLFIRYFEKKSIAVKFYERNVYFSCKLPDCRTKAMTGRWTAICLLLPGFMPFRPGLDCYSVPYAALALDRPVSVEKK